MARKNIKCIMCSNPKSEYYKSLLNVDSAGNELEVVARKGCRCGERRVDK